MSEAERKAREVAQELYDRATRGDWPNITVDRIARALLQLRRDTIEECARVASGESGPYPAGKPIVGDETASAMQAVLHQVRLTIATAIRRLSMEFL